MSALAASRPPGHWGLAVLALAVVYYAAARLGLLLAFEGSNASPVWPPSGIALAALLLYGWRMLPGVALGALVANLVVFSANDAAEPATRLLASLAIMGGNALEALVGALVLRRWVGARHPFDDLAGVAKFIVVVLGAAAVSAAVGSATLLLAGIVPAAALGAVALTWWTGDVSGMLVLAPLLITLGRTGLAPFERRQALEALALLAAVLLLGTLVLLAPQASLGADRRFVWLFVPCIAWAAFRHGSMGVGATSLLIAGLAVWGTTHDLGPFARGNLNDALIGLQTFVALCTVTGLLLAADRHERLRLGRAHALRHDLLTPWMVLMGCLGVAVLGWHVVASDTERRASERFTYLTADIRDRMVGRMTANTEVLRGAAGLFAASRSVERAEWKAYVERLELPLHYPGIQAVGFARHLLAGELAAHVSAVRAEGFPGYDLRPAGERAALSSIVYIEPFDARNQRAFGFDMFTEPVRRAAMERARDSGAPTLSGKVTLLQETAQDVQAGALLYLAVYRNGAPTGSVAERRAALLGYVYSPFRMSNLMQGALGPVASDAGVAVRLYDGAADALDAKDLLFEHGSAALNGRPLFASRTVVEQAGRPWSLQVDTLPRFEATVDLQKARIVLIAGVGISLLLFVLVRSLTLTRERAELLAADMTLALRESEARLRDSERAAQQELALRRQADAALAAKNEALARSNAELAQFAYVASHDLQEPLRTVASYSQLLLRRHRAELPREAQEFVDFIGEGARRAQALVADLLSLARLDSQAEAMRPVALGELLDEVRRRLDAALREAGARLDHDALPSVRGDRGQLGQLLQNLVSNAVKFRGSEPPRVHVGARREPDGRWRISVADNGIGIDPRFHERIFTLFQRLHRADYPGTGIGLAICKKVVERHGGRIGVESTPGQGATFFFTIADQGDARTGTTPDAPDAP